MYDKVLIPILEEKAEHLHAEGLAGAIWALGQYDSGNSDLVVNLLNHYESKHFGNDIVFVSNTKYSMDSWTTAENTHGFELDSTDDFKKMYFQDHIVCLELYQGLKNLQNQSLSSEASEKVSQVLGDMEERHKITSDSMWYFKQLTENSSTVSTT